jgi:hypothetical protein
LGPGDSPARDRADDERRPDDEDDQADDRPAERQHERVGVDPAVRLELTQRPQGECRGDRHGSDDRGGNSHGDGQHEGERLGGHPLHLGHAEHRVQLPVSG